MIIGQEVLLGREWGLGRVTGMGPGWVDATPYKAGYTMRFDAKNVQEISILAHMGARYTHYKHPAVVYRVLTHEGMVQAREPLKDCEEVTIYTNDEGEWFVRRKTEFADGRFTKVN